MTAVPVVRAMPPSEQLAGRASSLLLAADRVLPATAALAPLLPAGGLQRGSTVLVTPGPDRAAGATSLALELLAGVSAAGGWCAAVGLADLGLTAAAERGVGLDRLLLVPAPGPAGRWQQVLAALFDGVDGVLFAPGGPVRPGDGRALAARARDRGAVLVVLDHHGRWREPADLRCAVARSACRGLGAGAGRVTGRRIEVEVTGRGAAVRPRRGALELSSAHPAA